MQLRSLLLASLLCAAQAQDSISINYLYYDEDSGRTTIKTPNFSLHKEFGTDYELDFSYTHDSVTGASPTFYDAATGASAKIPDGVLLPQDITYGNIPYTEDRRAYALLLTKRLPVTRDELRFGYNFSHENDYIAKELSFEYLHYTDKTKNQSLSYGISYQLNYPKIPCYLNHPECDAVTGASSITKRAEVITAQIGLTQILTPKSLIKASIFTIIENGYLSNPYMHVVRNYHSYSPILTAEKKPENRKAVGLQLEYKEAFEHIDMQTKLRLYRDDWEISSLTIDMELNKELTQKLTAGIKGRYYVQSSAYFYSGSKEYFTDQTYASSDRRMSSFASYEVSLCFRYHLSDIITLNFDGSYYNQPRYLDAKYFGIGVEYRF